MKRFNLKFKLLLILFFFPFFIFGFQQYGEWRISYKIKPEYPAPGDFVELRIYSYSFDLDGSKISYFLNKKYYDSGMGKKKIIFQLPYSYSEFKINIVAEPFSGPYEKKEIIIRPANLDLIYEVQDSYKPLFYKGKSYAVSHSKVKFFAFPDFYTKDGRLIDKKTLIYSWKLNGKIISGKSGYGRDTFIVNRILGYPKKTEVDLTVRTADERTVAERTAIINPVFPKINFYLDDGILPFKYKNVDRDGTLISGQFDTSIIAVPLFFSETKDALKTWRLNGIKINLLDRADPFRMKILRNEKNIFARLPVSLEVLNNNRILQTAKNSISLISTEELKSEFKQKKELEQFNRETGQQGDSFFGL